MFNSFIASAVNRNGSAVDRTSGQLSNGPPRQTTARARQRFQLPTDVTVAAHGSSTNVLRSPNVTQQVAAAAAAVADLRLTEVDSADDSITKLSGEH
jgi:hypothetical protein